ncbi:hypothetical protein JOQ06_027647, partial [Pogonophryne albipinna]
MAAMIASANTAGLSSHGMEEKKFEYFSSINSMARKIMQERKTIEEKHGPTWEKMTHQEQDSAIDNEMMDPQIRARYAMHRVEREEVLCYPKLLIQTGQKIVHFGEESQLDFSLTSGPAEQGVSVSQAESKPAKVPHSNQISKSTPGTKVTVSEARRPEEESSFWKISAERSRLEGEMADFQSLTPSQIKSLEKGEKSLPSYLRLETSVNTKEPEVVEPPPPAHTRSTKHRAPKPPGCRQSVAGWERSQSTLPSVGTTVDEVFSSGMMPKPSKPSNPPG